MPSTWAKPVIKNPCSRKYLPVQDTSVPIISFNYT